MISCDTNILFPSCDSASPHYHKARGFLELNAHNTKFCLSEQVLMELYCLLRNPAACRNPLSAPDAVRVIHNFRDNPHWKIIDVNSSKSLMKRVWEMAAKPDVAYRRIFDLRLASTLIAHGVTDLATQNSKDFIGTGLKRVWNPLTT